MNIKERIAELPGEMQTGRISTLKQYVGKLPDEESMYRTNDPSAYPLCSVGDLKALAASHTALLEAAQGVLAVAGGSPRFDILQDAVAEAEKL